MTLIKLDPNTDQFDDRIPAEEINRFIARVLKTTPYSELDRDGWMELDETKYAMIKRYLRGDVSELTDELKTELDNDIDMAWEYYQEDADVVGESNEMGGADRDAYSGGKWYATLYKIKSWYYWQEPEGIQHGFFTSKRKAIEFGNRNWV